MLLYYEIMKYMICYRVALFYNIMYVEIVHFASPYRCLIVVIITQKLGLTLAPNVQDRNGSITIYYNIIALRVFARTVHTNIIPNYTHSPLGKTWKKLQGRQENKLCGYVVIMYNFIVCWIDLTSDKTKPLVDYKQPTRVHK